MGFRVPSEGTARAPLRDPTRLLYGVGIYSLPVAGKTYLFRVPYFSQR